jgi:hypothetical protein
MSQGQPLSNLQNAGYSQYQLQPNQQMGQEEQGFEGYNATTGAAPSYGQLQQTQAQQQGLANSLQAQAAGAGPNPALAQLQQTTDANIKNQAALSAGAAASGAGGAGAARYNAANQAGTLNQQAGGQAAVQAAQQQLGAQQAQAGVLGTMGGQNLTQAQQQQQLALENAGMTNQANQFTSQAGQNQAALLQQNYEFGQGLQAQQQSQQNSAVAALQGQQQQQQAAWETAGIQGGVGLIGSALGAALAKGGVVDHGKFVAGEAGPEAEVPVPRQYVPRATRQNPGRMADGGMVSGPDFSSHIAALNQMTQQTIANIGGARSAPSQPSAPAAAPSPFGGIGSAIGKAIKGKPTSAGFNPQAMIAEGPTDDQPALGGTPAVDPSVGAMGDFASAAPGGMAAKGRLLTQPTVIEAGEKGPEAIIPVKGDGSADMKRAKDPGVRKLIADHPEYKHPLSVDADDQTMKHLAELEAEVKALKKVLKSTKRAA